MGLGASPPRSRRARSRRRGAQRASLAGRAFLSSYPWEEIFRVALERLPVTTTPAGGGFDFDNNGGDLRWTPGRYWTTINLRLTSGSLLKRQLIAGTLLKAARYQLE